MVVSPTIHPLKERLAFGGFRSILHFFSSLKLERWKPGRLAPAFSCFFFDLNPRLESLELGHKTRSQVGRIEMLKLAWGGFRNSWSSPTVLGCSMEVFEVASWIFFCGSQPRSELYLFIHLFKTSFIYLFIYLLGITWNSNAKRF